ncbi:XdhC/CoxI family protein [Lacibacter luteus]|uniref:XdhC/CoxI family protein n=1 Tax=Lacibacter luteus TaxID=2508719 RepID=A0A4Q1CM80_9BACT|nr:XdhC/CoxI family protein [Lacibacter luteus]RXK61719.1 XdhC/CoxI family protein [Lacibacter luteus]
MTKEINEIIRAYQQAKQKGIKTALATVVYVEGSSYRRPGARMLVEEDGRMTGAISGGCLEGDALRKALLAIHQQQNKLVTYNTLDEEDVEFGVQLGCNGIVHILFEPIDAADENNPIALLERSQLFRRETVLVTLFSLHNFHGHQPGTCFFLDAETVHSKIDDEGLKSLVQNDAASLLATGASVIKEYDVFELTAFVELLQPAVSLIIIGAGNDAFPLVEMTKVLDWQITVADGRSTHANVQRFPNVQQLITGKPETILSQLVIDEWTVFLLMTHNYKYDYAMLKLLLKTNCRYIGTLGPKKRLERMYDEMKEEGIVVSEEQKAVIHGPIGLDIGAEAAEEIALSVLAEIKAVFAQRTGGFLKNRSVSIHSRNELTSEKLSSNGK